ncbi:hypothetical protein POKO110462_21740 [Pontibacter korlensis]|uniref:EF-hand domain-containing protein n=1 Tax=Pontibacter korlensis TaxID=400092 RepID=A0A0E3ZGZ2_9BACT|nr:hypothetical protein [Pontibacter korlensis]AKD05193.1 hypothetical protein PKOR_21640 [Pontibacter korlensis]
MKTTERSLFKLIRNAACFALLAGFVACGGEGNETTTAAENDEAITKDNDANAGVMDNWDTDKFNESFATNNYYDEWDEDNDEKLTEEEFYTSFYTIWDQDDNNEINEQEWTTATNDFGIQNQSWSSWDANGDGKLEEEEFRKSMTSTNLHQSWDKNQDKMIDEQEYTSGVFALWDDNGDGSLGGDEYNERYVRYYGKSA